jgi:hypothetical protein
MIGHRFYIEPGIVQRLVQESRRYCIVAETCDTSTAGCAGPCEQGAGYV